MSAKRTLAIQNIYYNNTGSPLLSCLTSLCPSLACTSRCQLWAFPVSGLSSPSGQFVPLAFVCLLHLYCKGFCYFLLSGILGLLYSWYPMQNHDEKKSWKDFFSMTPPSLPLFRARFLSLNPTSFLLVIFHISSIIIHFMAGNWCRKNRGPSSSLV